MEIKSDIKDLERALKDAEYYAAHLISDVVSNYRDELDLEKKNEIEVLKDAAVRTLQLIRSLKTGRADSTWTKSLIDSLTNLYEAAKKEKDEDED